MALETDRLRLIEMNPEIHAAELNQLILDSFESLNRFLFFAQKRPSIEDTKKMLETNKENKKNGKICVFGIYSKEHNKIIGLCTTTNLRSHLGDSLRPRVDSPEFKNPWLIGYWIGSQYEGRGYVTEATQALINYAATELNIDCFLAHVDSTNQKSSAVVKRLGFDLYKETYIENKLRTDWPKDVPCLVYIRRMGN